jgi:transposase
MARPRSSLRWTSSRAWSSANACRAREFLNFLRRIDRAAKKPRDIHLVLDTYATHKTPQVRAWLEMHPRVKLHFTPTSASSMNLVERFFAEITTKRIRRGRYSGIDDLEDAICDHRVQHNTKPKPFVWSKTAEDIIAPERRALVALDEIRENQEQMSDPEQ